MESIRGAGHIRPIQSTTRYCPDTRAYVARRTADGLTKPEIIRCLKRNLAREIYRTIR